ncbi:MAG: hypothetical protein ACKV2T_04025 [Kofleriaceae bacterium]
MSWSISYADGAANAYHFRSEEDGAVFTYDPVTPERSSTGLYSGGAPRSGHLDAQSLAALWTHVRALATNTALHGEDRNKGTGWFQIDEGSGTQSFIIRRGPELAAFDSFVASL